MTANRNIRLLILMAALAACSLPVEEEGTAATSEVANGDAANGKVVFEQQCTLCHSVAEDGSGEIRGPNLFGLIGRRAGSEPDFAMYSPALRAYDVNWTRAKLDEFLSDPMARVPGTTMPMMVADGKDRADLVAYIASLR